MANAHWLRSGMRSTLPQISVGIAVRATLYLGRYSKHRTPGFDQKEEKKKCLRVVRMRCAFYRNGRAKYGACKEGRSRSTCVRNCCASPASILSLVKRKLNSHHTFGTEYSQ